MPHELDEKDIAIISLLMKDGRKLFRQLSKELSISSPTVKSRYQRLVNLGFITSVSPILDMSKITKNSQRRITTPSPSVSESRIKKGHTIQVTCNYCEGEIHGKPRVLRFGDHERFFCCTSCRTLYKEKHGGRINSLLKQDLN